MQAVPFGHLLDPLPQHSPPLQTSLAFGQHCSLLLTESKQATPLGQPTTVAADRQCTDVPL